MVKYRKERTTADAKGEGKMPTEAEKRLHRCCLAGHRPEELKAPEEEVQQWLRRQIDDAVAAGYRTFISNLEPGVNIVAAQIVREKKEKDPSLHLICAVPWPHYEEEWNFIWQVQYRFLLEKADLVKYFLKAKTEDDKIIQRRREWTVNHCSRLIAFCDGSPGETWDTIEYAAAQGIGIVSTIPELVEEYRKFISGKPSGE